MAVFAEGIRNPGEVRLREFRYRHKDGSWRMLEGIGKNLLDQPTVAGILVSCRDVSGRKLAEEQREQLLHELEAAHERLRLLPLRLMETQEQERRQIARELHDQFGGMLTALKLTLDRCPMVPVEAKQVTDDLIERTRGLSLQLRPLMLDDLGLLPALADYIERFAHRTEVRVNFKHRDLGTERFRPEVETAAYRIVQEALTNVARHAQVKEATVRVWVVKGSLFVQVEDCGRGFDTEMAWSGTSTSGLAGMRERASLLGGRFSLESSPGAGARLTVDLPLFNRQESGQPDKR
jgi:signal transduction histidine kinase